MDLTRALLLLIPATAFLVASVLLLSSSYRFYLGTGHERTDAVVKTWIVGSFAVWVVTTVIILLAVFRRRYGLVWVVPFLWLGATEVWYQTALDWLPAWFPEVMGWETGDE